MRRILLAATSTLAVVVALFGYRTSTPGALPAAPVAVAAAGGAGNAAGSTKPASPGGSSTVLGSVVDTRWGPVQVQITVAGGRVTAATAVQVPYANRRDVAINARAVPVLEQETVAAQSAAIDAVSGATYTSDGYVTSLQAALDRAGL